MPTQLPTALVEQAFAKTSTAIDAYTAAIAAQHAASEALQLGPRELYQYTLGEADVFYVPGGSMPQEVFYTLFGKLALAPRITMLTGAPHLESQNHWRLCPYEPTCTRGLRQPRQRQRVAIALGLSAFKKGGRLSVITRTEARDLIEQERVIHPSQLLALR